MIKTGIDGLSRGDFEMGVSLGYTIRHYSPLARTAFALAELTFSCWLMSWMGEEISPPLTPEGWFSMGHLPGMHVWASPPVQPYSTETTGAEQAQETICQYICYPDTSTDLI